MNNSSHKLKLALTSTMSALFTLVIIVVLETTRTGLPVSILG